jgi:hypothetical protein
MLPEYQVGDDAALKVSRYKMLDLVAP